MAPSAVSEVPALPASSQNNNKQNGEASCRKPLDLFGALDCFKFEESTPVIGREYLNVDIVDDLLNADNADERLRDLAITSRSYHRTRFIPSLTAYQSHNAALSSSARNQN